MSSSHPSASSAPSAPPVPPARARVVVVGGGVIRWTMALAKGARLHGATILERTPVLGVLTAAGPGGRRVVRGVRTAHGDVEAEIVVNCAGMWARQLGEADGVALPLQAAEHYYLIVDGVDGITPELPVLEDPGAYGYYREETGGRLVGLFEPVAAPWSPQAV